MIIGRLLMRVLLVPFGGCIAILAAVVFVTVAHWTRFAALVAANRGGDGEFDAALFFAGAVVVFLAAISAAKMLWPMILGALIAEAFAIRSWVFHVCNGGVSACSLRRRAPLLRILQRARGISCAWSIGEGLARFSVR